MKGKCTICGEEIRSHRSSKNSARANFLKAMRKHQWKKHRNTMISRIKAGKASAQKNPSVQDMVSALQEGPRSALKIYRSWTERQFQHMKVVMDAIEPLLPLEMKIAWRTLEAIHDDRVG